MKKICLIISYFGKTPSWFNFFLESCLYNPTIDWILYTNIEKPENAPKNIRFIKASLSDFSSLASEKLELEINIKKPYKICDFKPAYGKIFQDYIKNYHFWGCTDLDIIYGNIRKFVTDKILREYDIISSKKRVSPGHFTLFKNKKKTNYLFIYNPDYKKILEDHSIYCGFDEFSKIKIESFNTQKRKSELIEYEGILGTAKKLALKNYLKISFNDFVKDADTKRKIKLKFNKGKLTDSEKEIGYFHIHKLKDVLLVPSKTNDTFYITEKEIFYNKKHSLMKKISARIKEKTKRKNFERKTGFLGKYLREHCPSLYCKLKRTKKGQILNYRHSGSFDLDGKDYHSII